MITASKASKIFSRRQLMIAVIILCIILITYFLLSRFSSERISNLQGSGRFNIAQSRLMEADDLLHARLLQIQQMDREYASLFNESGSDVANEVARLSIRDAEETLRITIDSMENGRTKLDENTSAELWKLTTYFKTIMENRRYLTAVKSASTQPASTDSRDRLYLMALEEELRQKEAFIAGMRAKSMKAGAAFSKENTQAITQKKSRSSIASHETANNEEEEMLNRPAPGETVEELRQRNINLKLAFNTTATQLGVLTKKYNLLVKDYQRMSNQLQGSSRN